MTGIRSGVVEIGLRATSRGPLGRGQSFLGGGFETRVLLTAGFFIKETGVVGLTVLALILELAIWGNLGEVHLAGKT